MNQSANVRPMLHEIAFEIRTVGKIWLIEKVDEGLVFRFEIGKRQARAFIPKPGLHEAEPPFEKSCPVHVVETLPLLRHFFSTI